MKQILIKGGGVVVEEVPAPSVSSKNVLVRVGHSCVSVGTEMASVKASGMPLVERALKQPENVKKVFGLVRTEGLRRTVDKVRGRLATGIPAGYSVAGEVIDVGGDVVGFSVGDRVACAGAGIANHAEIVDVPVNLTVRIPEGLATAPASTVALGSIAMQGVRRAQPTLGETFGVIGLGILGQLTVQFLRASGCRVVGADLDPQRVEAAQKAGMNVGLDGGNDFVERLHAHTNGIGADGVIICAAGASDEIVSMAMRGCRRKGRVILVGDVGLNLKRADFYAKELDFLVSTSYGPGRYDPLYEEEGIDYPLPYVRWTEKRNMEEYLALLAEGRVTLGDSVAVYDVEKAPSAYQALKGEGEKPMVALLSYPKREGAESRVVSVIRRSAPKSGAIGVGVAGAGLFAVGMHLPNLVKLRDRFTVASVMSRNGAKAKAAAAQFDGATATTDYNVLLADPAVDVVMITSRHNTHADLTLRALTAGKHVFVEKPLALKEDELDAIEAFYVDAGPDAPTLMTGYNRRFAPAINQALELLQERTTPIMASYRMNVGYLPPEHWTQTGEGGGRNIGEACHIYDLFAALTGAELVDVAATSVMPKNDRWRKNDNFSATLSYTDGSVCTLLYTAQGAGDHPKERLDIYADGMVVSLDDYRGLAVAGRKSPGWKSPAPDKGHLAMLTRYGDALAKGEWLVPLETQLAVARAAFRVEALIDG